jgi:hypothetical protein
MLWFVEGFLEGFFGPQLSLLFETKFTCPVSEARRRFSVWSRINTTVRRTYAWGSEERDFCRDILFPTPPSNTTLNVNITKVLEHAPG